MRTLFLVSVLGIAAAACSDDTSDDPRWDGAVPLDAGDAGGLLDAQLPDGGQLDGSVTLSILSRASSSDYDCGVSQELLNYKPLRWGYQGHDLEAAGASTWLARVQAVASNNPFEPGEASFVLSSIDVQGKLGPSVAVASVAPRLVSKPAVVALEDGAFALFWKENQAEEGRAGGDISMLRFATFDGAGKSVQATQTLLTETAELTLSIRAARASGGQLGVLWSGGLYSGSSRTQLLVIDASGGKAAEPRVLTERAFQAGELIADGSGFAVLYQDLDASTQRSDVLFARFDAAGAPVGSAVALTKGSKLRQSNGIGSSRLALLRSGEHYLAAWTEGEAGRGLNDQTGGYRVLRVARLDASGTAVSAAFLRDQTENIDEEEPVLTAYGDSVALTWGRASHIYVCGGCVPDHTAELVLLDPVTLTPRSNVAKVDAPQGGLLDKHVAVQGSSLLTTMEITFHVHSEPGFASFQCTKK